MKPEEAGFLALRLLAFWYILMGLFGLASSTSFFLAGPGARVAGFGQLLFSLVTVVLAIYVFVNTRRVSRFFFSSLDEVEVSVSGRTLLRVGFAVIGAYLAASALPGLFTNLVEFLWVLRAGAAVEREAFFVSETLYELAYDGSMVAVGAFLFFRSSRLADRWGAVPESGGPEDSTGDEDS